MNSYHIFARMMLALLALAAFPVAKAPAQDTFPIALVNVDRIYKVYAPLQEQLAPLKEQAQEVEQKAQLRQAEIETVANQLRQAQPNSPEFQRLQGQLAKLQNELRQFIATERGSLEKKQSKLFLTLYRDMEDEIAKHAKANGIKLVIRTQETTTDNDQPFAATLATVNRGIIYQDGIDITDAILKALEARKTLVSQER